jgi:hypothetical protein
MKAYCIQKIPFSTCCSTLIAKIRRLRAIAIIACTLYARMHIMCVFSRDSIKCSKCTYKSVSYDRNFLEANFDKLSKEKAKLEAT